MDTIVPLFIAAMFGPLLIWWTTRTLPPSQARFIQVTMAVALLLRVSASAMFDMFPTTRIFHEDAEGYEILSIEIANAWRGEGPPVPPIYLTRNSHNYGFYYVLAAWVYLFGRYRLNATIFNSLIGTLNVLVVYRIGLLLFHDAVARRAARMVAFFPSMVLFSSLALKDPLVSLLICLTLYYCIRLRDRFSFGALAGTVLTMVAIYPIRFYLVYVVAACVVGTMFLNRRGKLLTGVTKQLVLAGCLLVAVAAFGLSGGASSDMGYFDLTTINRFRHNMAITAHSGFAAETEVKTPGQAILFLPIGITELLWGPFPWQMTSLRPLVMAPEMVMLWALIPALFRGILFAVRVAFREYSPLIVFSVAMCIVYALMAGNVGAAVRQRAQIFNVMFLFIALGRMLKIARRNRVDTRLLVRGAPEMPRPAAS
jgi:4-amino-4-deoxy-L-arabinose transferase-like glycosyltransferase